MGIDYYACVVCGDAFPDVIDYGHCSNCEETLCEGCRDEMGNKYGVLGEDHELVDDFGEEAPLKCDECTKPPTISKEDTLTLLEALYNDIQYMREEGETDLRTVLHFIDEAKIRIANM